MTTNEIREIIKQEATKIHRELYEEILSERAESEKQRKWGCAQMDKAASQRPEGLSKEEAEKLCKDPIKKESSSGAAGSAAGYSSPLGREELAEKILNTLLSKEKK